MLNSISRSHLDEHFHLSRIYLSFIFFQFWQICISPRSPSDLLFSFYNLFFLWRFKREKCENVPVCLRKCAVRRFTAFKHLWSDFHLMRLIFRKTNGGRLSCDGCCISAENQRRNVAAWRLVHASSTSAEETETNFGFKKCKKTKAETGISHF